MPYGAPGTLKDQQYIDSVAFLLERMLLRHPEQLKQNPSEWMPWNYRETLARLATPAAASRITGRG